MSSLQQSVYDRRKQESYKKLDVCEAHFQLRVKHLGEAAHSVRNRYVPTADQSPTVPLAARVINASTITAFSLSALNAYVFFVGSKKTWQRHSTAHGREVVL